MNLLIRGRAAGKTTESVKFAEKHGGILIVKDEAERQRIIKLYAPKRAQICTWKDKEKLRLLRRHGRPIIIDNLDLFIHEMIPIGVSHATLTAAEWEIE